MAILYRAETLKVCFPIVNWRISKKTFRFFTKEMYGREGGNKKTSEVSRTSEV